MRNPIKLLFMALPLLIVATVSWYLQNPFGDFGFNSVDKKKCQPSSDEANGPETSRQPANTMRDEKNCNHILISAQDSLTGDLITNIRLFQFNGIHTQWTLRALSAQHEGEERVIIQKPSLTIYKKDGQMVSVTSTNGSMDSRSQAIVFTGNVIAKNQTQRLATEILRFDPHERILYTERRFLLEKGSMRLEGVGLTIYQETKKLVVSHRVKFQIQSQVNALRDRLSVIDKDAHHTSHSYTTPQREMFRSWNS